MTLYYTLVGPSPPRCMAGPSIRVFSSVVAFDSLSEAAVAKRTNHADTVTYIQVFVLLVVEMALFMLLDHAATVHRPTEDIHMRQRLDLRCTDASRH